MSDDQHRKRQISLGYVVLGLLLIFVLQFFMVRGVSQEIPYSEFKQYLEQGKLRDLTLSPTDIRGTLVRNEQDQQTFVTNRVEDPELVVPGHC